MDSSRRILEEYYNEENISYACPSWAPTLGFVGIASAVVFASKLVSSWVLPLVLPLVWESWIWKGWKWIWI